MKKLIKKLSDSELESLKNEIDDFLKVENNVYSEIILKAIDNGVYKLDQAICAEINKRGFL